MRRLETAMAMHADPVSTLLGVADPGEMAILSAVRRGLEIAAVDRIANAVAPEDQKFLFRLVPRATLSRRRAALKRQEDARLSVEEGERLARFVAVWHKAIEVWKNAEDARRFLFETHPLLDGRRPIDLVLESELGRPIVENLLGRMEYGAAV
jgi:putative toxin-antitoxin system antitoxin component (TIGR02293 family)